MLPRTRVRRPVGHWRWVSQRTSRLPERMHLVVLWGVELLILGQGQAVKSQPPHRKAFCHGIPNQIASSDIRRVLGPAMRLVVCLIISDVSAIRRGPATAPAAGAA